jgi:hypothetical protein
MVTAPGAVGSALDGTLDDALVAALLDVETLGTDELAVVPVFAELPLLPQAARASSPSTAMTAR